MDPIGRLGGTAVPTPMASAVPRRSGEGFALPTERDALPATTEMAPSALSGLLALQEQGEVPTPRDRDARRHGRRLLEELAALQRDLLSGRVTGERLARLTSLVAELPPVDDPGLRAARDAVVLRARIELARYGKA
jgi:hypothetical protein